METLYIDRKHSKLEVKGARLLVHITQQRPVFSVPLDQVQRIVLSTGVELSSTVISKLTQHGVTLICLNPRNIDGCAVTTGLLHNDANRRLRQYRIVSSEQSQLFYAQRLVVAKLTGQRAQLSKALIVRPDRRRQLTGAMNTLGEMTRRCPDSENLEALNGLEGAGAAAYFGAYCSLFAPRLEFTVKGKLRCQLYFPVIANTLLSHWFEHVEFDCDIKQLYGRWLEGQTRHILAQLNVPRGCPEHASAQLAQQMRTLGRKSLGSDRWDSAMDWLAGMLMVQLSQIVVEYGLANQSRGKRKLLDDIGPVFSLWLTARFVSRIAPYKRKTINGVSMSAFYQEQSQGIDYMIRRMLIQLITRLESIV